MKLFPLLSRLHRKAIRLAALLCSLLCVLHGHLAAELTAQSGELLLRDDFGLSDFDDWQPLMPSFAVQSRVLKGRQTRVLGTEKQ